MENKIKIWYDSKKRTGQYVKDDKVITFKDVTHSEFCELLENHINGVK